jgi:hypothetical protein
MDNKTGENRGAFEEVCRRWKKSFTVAVNIEIISIHKKEGENGMV